MTDVVAMAPLLRVIVGVVPNQLIASTLPPQIEDSSTTSLAGRWVRTQAARPLRPWNIPRMPEQPVIGR